MTDYTCDICGNGYEPEELIGLLYTHSTGRNQIVDWPVHRANKHICLGCYGDIRRMTVPVPGVSRPPTPPAPVPAQLNVNDNVLIRITPAGEEVWIHYWLSNGGPHSLPPAITRDDSGLTRIQLRLAMRIFGPAMQLDADPPFEVTILVPDPSQPG